MFEALKNLFRTKPSVDFKALIKLGAQIIDVRTEGEYRGGHIVGSLNISLNALQHNLKKIKTDKPIITCCASGIRSASAKSILISYGFTNVHNGGGWMSLQNKIK